MVKDLLLGVMPGRGSESLCQSCKRSGNVCTLVTKGAPCMGAITRGGCGAICPKMGRDCYGCSGPISDPNQEGIRQRLGGIGLLPDEIDHRLAMIHGYHFMEP